MTVDATLTVVRLPKPGRGECRCCGPVTHAVMDGGRIVFTGCVFCARKRAR